MAKRTTKRSEGVDTNSSYTTPALEKGLDVLELLAHEPAGLTKSAIARKLNRTVSEIFRMLVCLEQRGYIAQVHGDEYALTLKLFELVHAHPPTDRLVSEALPVLHRLAQKAQQSCHLAVIENGRVVILAQVNAPTNVGFYVKLGTNLDMLEASSGYVILAHMEEKRRDATLAEWQRVTGRSIPSDLKKHLQRIQRAGFEERASYQVKGIANISYPIFDVQKSALAALTVPYVEAVGGSVTQAQVREAVADAAREITTAIGGQQPG